MGSGSAPAGTTRRPAGSASTFPPTAERFERLEETLQICLQMWSGSDAPYEGTHYQLGRTLNSPASTSQPRPRIMIGGTGERKTLRLVAQYADACNIFPGPDVAHKLEVLRGHCAAKGRDYDSIEKTTTLPGDLSDGPDAFIEQLRPLHELGFTAAHLYVPGPEPLETVELLGAKVIPEISTW